MIGIWTWIRGQVNEAKFMETFNILQACLAIIILFQKKAHLTECELLAYEQACRLVESTLKDYRKMLEDLEHGELENFTK